MEQKKKKFGLFRQIGTAVAKPKKYYDYMSLGLGRIIGFVFLFTFLCTLVSYYIPLGIQMATNESYREVIDNYVPEFTLQDGVLSMEDPLEYDDGTTIIIANSDIESFSEKDFDDYADYGAVYMISRTNIQARIGTEVTTYLLRDFAIETLTRETLYDYLPMLYIIVIISGILAYLTSTAMYFIGALGMMLLARIYQSVLHSAFTYMELFKVAVFSKVTMRIIEATAGLFGYTIPYSFYLSAIVSFIYISFAMRFMKRIADSQQEAHESSRQSSFIYYNNPADDSTESDASDENHSQDENRTN